MALITSDCGHCGSLIMKLARIASNQVIAPSQTLSNEEVREHLSPNPTAFVLVRVHCLSALPQAVHRVSQHNPRRILGKSKTRIRIQRVEMALSTLWIPTRR